MTTLTKEQREALKPCPCCAGQASFDHDDDGWNWIECGVCGLSTNRRASCGEDCLPLLAEAWNRRAAPSADDAGISEASIAACALMIKGICMTHTQDVWTTKIAERIKFMLIAAPTPEDAPSAAQGVTLTDEQIDAIVRKACHSDPVTADGEYCLTVDEIRNLLAAAKPASVDAPPASGATRDYAKSDAEFESKTGRSLDLTGNFYQIDRIDGEADAPYRERIRPVRAAWLRRMRNCYR